MKLVVQSSKSTNQYVHHLDLVTVAKVANRLNNEARAFDGASEVCEAGVIILRLMHQEQGGYRAAMVIVVL